MKFTDSGKQQARMSILQRLKQKGMPIGPFPGNESEEEPTSFEQAPEETLNDLGPAPDLEQRMNRTRKKKPIPSGSL